MKLARLRASYFVKPPLATSSAYNVCTMSSATAPLCVSLIAYPSSVG